MHDDAYSYMERAPMGTVTRAECRGLAPKKRGNERVRVHGRTRGRGLLPRVSICPCLQPGRGLTLCGAGASSWKALARRCCIHLSLLAAGVTIGVAAAQSGPIRERFPHMRRRGQLSGGRGKEEELECCACICMGRVRVCARRKQTTATSWAATSGGISHSQLTLHERRP